MCWFIETPLDWVVSQEWTSPYPKQIMICACASIIFSSLSYFNAIIPQPTLSRVYILTIKYSYHKFFFQKNIYIYRLNIFHLLF